jgi:outer membrane biosynthesis protein TonB
MVSPQLLTATILSMAVHSLLFLRLHHQTPPPPPHPEERPVLVLDAPAPEATMESELAAGRGGTPTQAMVQPRAHPRSALPLRGHPSKPRGSPASTATVTPEPSTYSGRDVFAELSAGDPNAGVDSVLYGEGTPGRDLSAPPRLGGPVFWDGCPWPASAGRAGVNHATVQVTVDVSVTGTPVAAHLVRDAGHDFGADAVECAMQYRYLPGRDPRGRAVAGRTRPFPVVFTRREVR